VAVVSVWWPCKHPSTLVRLGMKNTTENISHSKFCHTQADTVGSVLLQCSSHSEHLEYSWCTLSRDGTVQCLVGPQQGPLSGIAIWSVDTRKMQHVHQQTTSNGNKSLQMRWLCSFWNCILMSANLSWQLKTFLFDSVTA